MDTTVADTLIGTTIDGRYRITGRVARGGMATVYTAIDERLERTVALKIIHPSQATNVHFVDRFTDEAKTIARLTHPNVVAVYDQGRHQGLPYLVMEYVQGRTLRDLLLQRRRLNPVEALAIHHEHRVRDYVAAHELTAGALEETSDAAGRRKENMRHRLARLERKLSKSADAGLFPA